MFLYRVRTDKDVEFTGAILQNAAEEENIVLSSGLSGMNGQAELILRGITIISDQNLAWELQFFSSDLFQESNLDLDTFIARWSFAAADGVQIGATGTYEYYIDGLEIPLWDDDRVAVTNAGVTGTGELHVALVNRSATSKIAGATGEIVVTFWVEPMQAGGGGA